MRGDAECVSPELRALLCAVLREIDRHPEDLPALRDALEALLAYLASPSGRTDANVRWTDYSFSGLDGWPNRIDSLPEPLRSILWDIGGQLHDTVAAPAIATMFESTPEQLLARVRRLE